MKIGELEKKLISLLFKSSEGLFAFTIFQRLVTTPKELFLAIDVLVKNEIILSEKEKLSLTKKGYEYAISNNLKLKNTPNKFSKIPEDFIGPSIEINAFYIPKKERNQNIIIDL